VLIAMTAAIVNGHETAGIGPSGIGSAGARSVHTTLPGSYVAVPGPWHWRWVKVENPPPGTPRYIRQRYRTIRYVADAPVP
jgi:hypothetical protein